MDFTLLSVIWLALVIAFAIIEGATAGLVSIWFALGAVAALLVSCFVPTLWVQIAVFIVVSLLALLATRPLAKKYLNAKFVPTNADGNVGRTGTVIERITKDTSGRIKLDGVDWIARSSETLEVGALCKIIKMDSATLTVTNEVPATV